MCLVQGHGWQYPIPAAQAKRWELALEDARLTQGLAHPPTLTLTQTV